ncbi:hypothetical protein GF369_04355 [Candidatus Peregrinibacteria bacterium]|nr:hypothetical protein [Candidatus Peregrinibacteria bacterium]
MQKKRMPYIKKRGKGGVNSMRPLTPRYMIRRSLRKGTTVSFNIGLRLNRESAGNALCCLGGISKGNLMLNPTIEY